MEKTIVFVDFDGTIMMEDTLDGSVRLFASSEEYRTVRGKLVAGEMTLSQVVRYAFDGAPSSRLGRMLEYVDSVQVRPGFSEFLDEMARRQIPVVVISGGIRQFVERRLAPYRDKILAIHAVDLDVSTEQMQLISPYDDGNELLKKTDVMALYKYSHAVGIGDSYTDMKMALAVDTIFARSELAQYLMKLKKPYLPYESFFDVIKAMNNLLL